MKQKAVNELREREGQKMKWSVGGEGGEKKQTERKRKGMWIVQHYIELRFFFFFFCF